MPETTREKVSEAQDHALYFAGLFAIGCVFFVTLVTAFFWVM